MFQLPVSAADRSLLVRMPPTHRSRRWLRVLALSGLISCGWISRAFAAEPPRARHAAKVIVVNDDGFSAFFSGKYQTADDLRRQVHSFRETQVAVLEWCIGSGSRVNFPSRNYELIGAGAKELPRRGDQLRLT